MEGFKFKVGEVVALKHVDDHRLSIIERMYQECPGGVQRHYLGRVLIGCSDSSVLSDDKPAKRWVYAVQSDKLTNYERFNEIELVAIPGRAAYVPPTSAAGG